MLKQPLEFLNGHGPEPETFAKRPAIFLSFRKTVNILGYSKLREPIKTHKNSSLAPGEGKRRSPGNEVACRAAVKPISSKCF